MDVVVRRAASRDWPSLWPLLVGMGVPEGQNEDEVRRRFARSSTDPAWCLALAFAHPDGAEHAVGYAVAQDHGAPLRGGDAGRIARLHDLFVAPAARRTGVGAALLAHVIGWAATRVRYLQWQAHETDAAPFYERLGHVGQPCPQPDYPEFEIEFPRP